MNGNQMSNSDGAELRCAPRQTPRMILKVSPCATTHCLTAALSHSYICHAANVTIEILSHWACTKEAHGELDVSESFCSHH